jgi:hypothetical protein
MWFKNLKLLLIAIFLLTSNVGSSIAASEIQADIRYLYVQPGQTLHNIVSKLYPNRKKDWPRLRREIVRINPESFVDGKESQMKAGVRLELPRRRVPKRKTKKIAPLYVGDVVRTQGQALAVNKDRVSRALSAGDRIYLGDKLITGEDGFMRLHMIDNALLDLRCYSIMVIEEYSLQDKNRRSIFNLLQGSLRKVTGEIGKWGDDVYELRTPIASVGVRGTEYALRVFQTKGCGGTVDTKDDGLYLKVIKGIVDVHNNKTDIKTAVIKGDTLYIKTPEAEPVKNVVAPGVLAPVVKEKKLPEPEPVVEESSDWGWWLLVLVLLAV